jgi:hypothetical protein
MIRIARGVRLAPLLVAGALACSSAGGAAPAPVPVAPPSDLPPVRIPEGVAPSFDGAVTGNGWVDGFAAAGSKYFREVAGVRGQTFELKEVATGDEQGKACGKDWRASSARSISTVTPDVNRTAGSAGFSLSAIAMARRGYWHTKATLSCTTINRTDAQAATMARGQAWIDLGGGAGDRDQLLIETTGLDAGEWALSVTDSAGQKLAPVQTANTFVAALSRGGRYSVAASVTARAAPAGARDSVEQRLRATVRVSSLRNALAAGTGRTPLPGLELPLEVNVAGRELAEQVQAALARVHPCAVKPGCGGKVSDLSVQSVSVRPAGGGARVDLVLAGSKRTPLTVSLIGLLQVRDDSLRLTDLRLAAGQPEIAKKKDLVAAAKAFGDRAAAAAVGLAARTDPVSAELRGRFPVKVGELCVSGTNGAPVFLGSRPAVEPSDFTLVFGAAPGLIEPCPRGRTAP